MTETSKKKEKSVLQLSWQRINIHCSISFGLSATQNFGSLFRGSSVPRTQKLKSFHLNITVQTEPQAGAIPVPSPFLSFPFYQNVFNASYISFLPRCTTNTRNLCLLCFSELLRFSVYRHLLSVLPFQHPVFLNIQK